MLSLVKMYYPQFFVAKRPAKIGFMQLISN